MARPVFVLGKQRSGTTWLANLLCSHPLIAGIEHARHYGIHESAFFSAVEGRYGDLTNRSNFIECVEVLAASDYFRLAGATREFLYSLWPTSYPQLFRAAMDRHASSRGAALWVEKTPAHTLLVERIASVYPDALFVGIVRDVREVTASSMAVDLAREPTIGSSRRRRFGLLLRTVRSWVQHNEALLEFASHSDRALVVRYDELKADLRTTLAAICDFLEVPPDENMASQRYAPNTSFGDARERDAILSAGEARFAIAAARFFGLLSRAAMARRSKRRPGEARRPLPSWFFRLLPEAEQLEPTTADSSQSKTEAKPRALRVP